MEEFLEETGGLEEQGGVAAGEAGGLGVIEQADGREALGPGFAADLEEMRGDLLAREQALIRRELRAEAREKLLERGLPLELADLLDYRDGGRCTASLDQVEGVFRRALQAEVNQRLRGAPPVEGRGQGAGLERALREALGLVRGD